MYAQKNRTIPRNGTLEKYTLAPPLARNGAKRNDAAISSVMLVHPDEMVTSSYGLLHDGAKEKLEQEEEGQREMRKDSKQVLKKIPLQRKEKLHTKANTIPIWCFS